MVVKIIFSDFPVVWGVLRATESARKNVGGDQKPCCVCGGEHSICRLSRETKQLTEDGNITNRNKQMSWRSTKGFGHDHRNFFQRLGLYHYFKTLNLLFESFVIIFTCLRKCNFLIAFIIFLLFSVYYCILFNLYVIALVCSLFQRFCEISRVSGWKSVGVCVVCCLRHVAAHHTPEEQNG